MLNIKNQKGIKSKFVPNGEIENEESTKFKRMLKKIGRKVDQAVEYMAAAFAMACAMVFLLALGEHIGG